MWSEEEEEEVVVMVGSASARILMIVSDQIEFDIFWNCCNAITVI